MGEHDGLRFDVIDPGSPEAVRALTAYFDELARRFHGGFEPGDTLVADAPSMQPPGGAFVVAIERDEIVACGGIVAHDDHTGEIKRMWVSPTARGRGLGRRMLNELEAEVGRLGYRRVVLDTNEVLDEAIALYRAAGYVDIDRYNDNPYAMHWFTKVLL